MLHSGAGRSAFHSNRLPQGNTGPQIRLSAYSVLETASANTVIGALSVANHPSGASGWTFAVDAVLDSTKFNISAGNLRTSGSWTNTTGLVSYQVQISATKAGQTSPAPRVITIPSLAVLGNLALSSYSYVPGTPSSGAITGAHDANEVITLSGGPTGLTINSAARTWAYDGSGTDATGTLSLTGTHPQASNSPHVTSGLAWTVSSVVPATAEIWITAIEADSTGVGIQAREAGDTDWTNVYQYRSRAPTGISSDTTPLDQAIAPDGTSYLSPIEYFGKQRQLDSGLPIYLVPHAYNGSRIVGSSNTWGVGQTLHEDSITRANAAIAAVIAAGHSANAIRVGFLTFGATNDMDYTTPPQTAAAWGTAFVGSVDDARGRIYKNGVSGATIGTDATVVMQGTLPEHRSGTSNTFESKMIELMGTQTNYKYFRQAEGNSADGVHANNAGNRLNGVGLAGTLTEAAPTITFPSAYTIYNDQKLRYEIVTSKPCWLTLTGPDAASFEIVPIDDLNTPGNVASSRTRWYLRVASNGVLTTTGDYNFTINAKGNGGTATQDVTITSVAAYGSQVETIVHSWNIGQAASDTFLGYWKLPAVPLKRGVNTIRVLGVSGSVGAAPTWNNCRSANGLIGTKSTATEYTRGSAAFRIYSAQDQTQDIYFEPSDQAPSAVYCIVTSAVGTTATPSSEEFTTAATSSSITRPTNGIVVGGGYATGGLSPTSGQTNYSSPATVADAGVMWAGYRTTTGAVGVQGGYANLFAEAWAKA